ncbi:hypothetical protein [Mycobacteroides abscessus]|uniref:hypothetical protein n=1 Tax=Mycobacteroides abscessus TaxID=36809 RepID=UPI0010517E21|nr:hypothetical protein [Mycobacteroides abscessus]
MTTTTETSMWTVIGHWENDRIVVEEVVPGEHDDHRPEDGTWDEGQFAASAEAKTVEEAIAAVRAEYEDHAIGAEDEGERKDPRRIVNRAGGFPCLQLYPAGAGNVAPMLEIAVYRSRVDGAVVVALYSKADIGTVKVNLNEVPLCATSQSSPPESGAHQ